MRCWLVVIALAACTEQWPEPTVLAPDMVAFATYKDTVIWTAVDDDDLVIRRRQSNRTGEVWRRAFDPQIAEQGLIAGPDGIVLAERNFSSCVRLTWIRGDGRSEELPLPDCTTDAQLYDQFDGGLILSGFKRIDLETHAIATWLESIDGALIELVRGDDRNYARVSRTEGVDVVSISRTDPPVVRTLATSVIGDSLFASRDAVYWYSQGWSDGTPMRVFRLPADGGATVETWFAGEPLYATQSASIGRVAWSDGSVWLADAYMPLVHRLSGDDTITTFELGFFPGIVTAFDDQLLITSSDDRALRLQGLP